MEKQIQILHLEDEERDAELVQAALDLANIPCQITRVQSANEFNAALQKGDYDLILADYSLPGYNGLAALNSSRDQYPHIPFIFVSGTLGEDAAISALTEGAVDYITKQKLSRLAPAIRRVLQEVENQTKRKAAEQELLEREREYRVLVETIPDLIIRYNTKLHRIYVNPAWEKASGVPAKDALNTPPVNAEYVETLQYVLTTGNSQTIEFTWTNVYGKTLFLECFIVPEYDQHGTISGVLSVGRDITERKNNERELLTLNRAINQSSDAVFMINEKLIFAYVNDAACRSLGYSREELLTMSPSDIDATITYDMAKELMREQFANGSFPRFETHHKTRAGRIFPVEISSSVVEYDGEKFSLTTVHDITKRKQTENALQEREKHSQSLLRLSRKLEQAQTYTEVLNAARDEVRDVIGYQNLWVYLFSPDKKQAKALFAKGPISDMVMSDDGTAVLTIQGDRMMEEIVETQDIVIVDDARTDARTDKKLVEKLGNRTLVNIPILLFDMHMGSIGVGTFGDEGVLIPTTSQQEYLKALASHMAVTLDRIHLLEERRQVEQSLRASEEKYRVLADNIPNVVFQCKNDSCYTFIYLNSAIENLTGYPQSDFLEKGLSFFDLYHPDDLKAMPTPEENNITKINRKPFHVTYRIRHKSGEWRWVDEWGTGILGPDGKVEYLEGIMEDITERKLAEQTLRESEERYRQLVNLSPDAIGIYKQGNIFYANPAMLHIVGSKNMEDMIGKPMQDFIHQDFHSIIQKRISGELGDTTDTFIEEKLTRLDGSSVDIEVAAVPYEYQGQQYTQVIARDITQRKQHEREREAIISVSTALRRASTRTGILKVILDQLIDLFEANGAMFVLPNAQNGGFINEMGIGPVGERMAGLFIPPEQGVCNWVTKNKTTYLNNHADQDPLFYRSDLLGDSHCVACAPLFAQEQEAIGALWVARQVDFAEQDTRLLNAIADIAANAIRRVMLFAQTELQLHHLIALHKIDVAISSNFDSNLTLNVILHNVKNELEMDAVDILLLSPITHTLDYVAGLGFRTRGIEQSHVKLADGYAGTAAQEYRTVSCPDLSLAQVSFSRSSLLADEEFAAHFATPLIVKGQVKGVLELFHRKAFVPASDWIDYFEMLATQAAIAIESASLVERLQRSNAELKLAYDATIEGWSRALDLRDKETEGHTQRVTEMALELADKMGIGEAEKQHLWRGSLLHDIGKMGVPDSILLKPGPLSEAEKQIMRQHPIYAYQMLSPINYLRPALDISYCHHEKWDGSGYPRGLKGEEIPLSARLFAIVDVFDALSSDRPYRSAWPHEDVYSYIQEQSGKHFDPQIVKIVLENKMW